ncbi:MMPL family transporter, partial [Mycobacterium avium]
MSTQQLETQQAARPRVARIIHRLSVPIILGWLAVAVLITIGVPSLEQVEAEHAVSLSPIGAPSFKAMERLGEDFKETNTGALAMILLEGQQQLGDDAHTYYDRLIRLLENDHRHVQHVQNFWGDPLTRGAAQSQDGKAAYVQVNLNGNAGAAAGDESVAAIRKLVQEASPPPGLKVYVTGPAPIVADMNIAGQKTVMLVTLASLIVIFVTLLLVYRSVITVILLLLIVGLELQIARGMVALLGHLGVVGLTTFAVNLLVAAVIATGTDYGIFFVGRYQEARQAGESREEAFYTTFNGVAKVVLASGLTIAGAVLCLSFTRLPYFQPLGIPVAVGISIAVLVALTLGPALLA